jgi:hypothetical protein
MVGGLEFAAEGRPGGFELAAEERPGGCEFARRPRSDGLVDARLTAMASGSILRIDWSALISWSAPRRWLSDEEREGPNDA